jgi:predicted O-linked N-acetylglucosamine transferase (SPINDLY family)
MILSLLVSLAKMGLVLLSVQSSRRQESSLSSGSLVAQARHLLAMNDTNTNTDTNTDMAFSLLVQAHAMNPEEPGLYKSFQLVFERRILLHDNSVDRVGLASILLEFAEYGAAVHHLEKAMQMQIQIQTQGHNINNHDKDKTATMLFSARASICDWTHLPHDSATVLNSVRACLKDNRVPAVHPYKALMWPCLSLADATAIARQHAYAHHHLAMPPPVTSESESSLTLQQQQQQQNWQAPQILPVSTRRRRDAHHHRSRRVRLGYLSPDFTGDHPLAFLMQHVFQFHDTEDFDVFLYSLVVSDGSPEVTQIQHSCGRWTVLPWNAVEAATRIQKDHLDILVDLCGYTGTSGIAEIMAQRAAPIQIAYMGFPGSTGAPYMDYLVGDPIVIPTHLRQYYSEKLILMPHSYFVNSHRHLQQQATCTTAVTPNNNNNNRVVSRKDYHLPLGSFVFCCHSRPEKIDPVTFRSWLRVLQQVPNSVLWLLRSGPEMESNLRAIAQSELFGRLDPNRLIFCDLAPRLTHLQRLSVGADVFLDTPAYNAHTVGCDCLSAGVPMISLLRKTTTQQSSQQSAASLVEDEQVVETDKMASRVGASLLTAIGLEDLIVTTMSDYEAIMIRCATDTAWFEAVRERLRQNRDTFPLLDTQQWVRHWEAGLLELVLNPHSRNCDIHILDHAQSNE